MRKGPDSRLPFTVDWSAWLAHEDDDEIDSAEWLVEGVTLDSPPPIHAEGKATAWLSGGTLGAVHPATCRIVTVGGRTDERTLLIRIEER
jgi:hypothetical protein